MTSVRSWRPSSLSSAISRPTSRSIRVIIDAIFVRPRLAGVRPEVRHLELLMRDREREAKKEGFAAVLAKKGEGVVGDQVVGVALAPQRDLLVIAPKVLRVIVVGLE